MKVESQEEWSRACEQIASEQGGEGLWMDRNADFFVGTMPYLPLYHAAILFRCLLHHEFENLSLS